MDDEYYHEHVPSSRVVRRVSVRASGWIPQYHGAWAMIVVPAMIGIMRSGWQGVQCGVLAAWWLSYFLFYALACAVKARRHWHRYRGSLYVYGGGAAVCAIAVLVADSSLAWWGVIYAPIVGVALWELVKRRERSVVSGFATVVAACLMLPVMWSAGYAGHRWGMTPVDVPSAIWLETFLLFGYFAGTVLYVKTNIRKRGSDVYLGASWVWHTVFCLIAVCAYVGQWCEGVVGAPLVAWWCVVAVRSIVVPLIGRKGKAAPVAAIGGGEVVLSLALLIMSVWSAL